MKLKAFSDKEYEFTKVKDAKGVEGFILRGFDSKKYYFRVYDKVNLDSNGRWTFIDYPIYHSDLDVKITGEAAFYHKKDGTAYLDHSPATLGMKKVEKFFEVTYDNKARSEGRVTVKAESEQDAVNKVKEKFKLSKVIIVKGI